MPSSTVEDYIKRLYYEEQHAPGVLVPMGRLAEAMNVVPGTVTTMIKALADSGLVNYEPRAGVRLTDGGRKLALHVLRRHRLVELFLVQTLGFDWSEVHDEAEELEHAISDKVLDKIDALLGFPKADPHGSPIPCANGIIAHEPVQPLSSCIVGTRYRIARVLDNDAKFLQFAERNGLIPDAHITLVAKDESADALIITCHDRASSCTLGGNAATRIFVALPPASH